MAHKCPVKRHGAENSVSLSPEDRALAVALFLLLDVAMGGGLLLAGAALGFFLVYSIIDRGEAQPALNVGCLLYSRGSKASDKANQKVFFSVAKKQALRRKER